MELWYPLAKRTKKMHTHGNYPKGYPEGAIVHFTSGHYGTSAIDTALKHKYAYFLIDHDGTVYQGAPLDEWGSHAGTSKHGNRTSVSKYYVGIEVACAGKLDKNGKSWFGKQYSPDEIRVRDGAKWHKYTQAQEDALIDLILWLEKNNPKVFMLKNVLGHQEICNPPGRKDDPGGCIERPMRSFRQYLYRRIGVKYDGT